MPAVVARDICTGCAGLSRQECIASCPYEAIGLVDGRALVDKDSCDECKICMELCPVRAIVLE